MHALNGNLPIHAPNAPEGCGCNGPSAPSAMGANVPHLWVMLALAVALGALIKK